MPQSLQFHQDAPALARPPASPEQRQSTEADILANLNDQTLDTLSLIPQPSPEFRLAAIRKTLFALQYFENPTKEEWLAAIDSNPEAPYLLEGHWSSAPLDAKVAAVITNPSIITKVAADETLELLAWLATYLRVGTTAEQLHTGPCWHTSTVPYFLPILTDQAVASQIALCMNLEQSPRQIARILIETGNDELPEMTRKLTGSVIPATP